MRLHLGGSRAVRSGLVVLLLVLAAGCATSTTPPTTTVTVTTPVTPTAPFDPASSPTPALVDTEGRPVPPAVEAGVRRIDAALTTGEPSVIKDLYERASGAATWPTVASRLSNDGDRIQLVRALRNPPEQRPEIAYLYSEGDHGLGITDAGKLAFVGVGQDPNPTTTTAAPTTTSPTTTSAAPDPTPFYVGRFTGHGRTLDVEPSGRGVYRFRTYTTCPSDDAAVPCEPNGPEEVGRADLELSEASGRAVRARVVRSNDETDVPSGRTLDVSSPSDGVVVLGSGADAVTFCRAGAYVHDCGA